MARSSDPERARLEPEPPSSAVGESTPPQGSTGTRVLAAISSMIDENVRLFRTGAATMVVGSGLTVAFLVYRRGLHGYTSASQVPASVFERRKRVTVRVAKITTSTTPIDPHTRDPSPKGYAAHVGGEEPSTAVPRGAFVDGEGRLGHSPRRDVLLHAEHITILRRLLRLQPRSLFPSAASDSAATFTLRLCGVSAEEEGVALAREELAKPLVGHYCDAELLFREQRLGTSPGGWGGVGLGLGGGRQAWPVAVCHIHRRRGALWRDLVQHRLDPKAGFGEHLLSHGLASLREELWWAHDDTPSTRIGNPATASSSSSPLSIGDTGAGDSEPLPALKRLVADRERLATAEDEAREMGRGLWADLDEKDDGEHGEGGEGGRGRLGWVVRAVADLFGGWR